MTVTKKPATFTAECDQCKRSILVECAIAPSDWIQVDAPEELDFCTWDCIREFARKRAAEGEAPAPEYEELAREILIWLTEGKSIGLHTVAHNLAVARPDAPFVRKYLELNGISDQKG